MRIDIMNIFNQRVIYDLELNPTELIILEHFYQFYSRRKMNTKEYDGDMYYHFAYDKVIDDLYFLRLSNKRLGEILIHELSVKPDDYEDRYSKAAAGTKKKLEKYKYVGLFKHHTFVIDNKKYTYFSPTDKLFSTLLDITTNDQEMKSVRYLELRKLGFKAKRSDISEIDSMETDNYEYAKQVCIDRNKKSSGYLLAIKKPSESANSEDLKHNNLNSIDKNSIPQKCKDNQYNNKNNYRPNKTAFHNFEETFTKYTTEELDRMIEESQKEKFK